MCEELASRVSARLLFELFSCACLQAQQHRTFNSAVARQANMGHYTKPVYSLNGRTPAHNSLMIDDGIGDDEDTDEEASPVGLSDKVSWVLN